ncbi:hypothetical protein M0R45_013931 [Rubus argutus]|uniref:Cyclic nucleotide-binding domain-containing protein n=1 Tax=Rubus argutus TaxID=59490 RepID=A0AAW1XK04_RUBAR
MDNQEKTGESFVVSLPSSPGNLDGIERQRPMTPTPIRNAWETVATLVRKMRLETLCIQIRHWILVHLLLDPWRNWKRTFILSCVAVSLDPLFLYIPIIDDKNKCLGMDKTLRNLALVFRALTDIAFIIHMILLIYDKMDDDPEWDDSNSDSDVPAAASWLPTKLKIVGEAIAEKMPWLSISIITNFLAILPIPQVAIVVVFFSMDSSELFLKRTIINVALLLQFLLRVCQMYLSSKEVIDKLANWVKGCFYFFLYILAAHVLAAFSLSDFGMFHDILQSGTTGLINFPTKFFYSFWWGLKNLSNFGTDLQTSSYVWENCFAVSICVIGLLLFLYLIGNVQLYIQSETKRLVKMEESRRRRIDERPGLIEEWMSRHGLPDDMKREIKDNIKKDALEKFINEDVDIDFICLRVCSEGKRIDMMEFVFAKALKKVPMLQNMDERELKVLYKLYSGNCTTLKKGSFISRAGKPVDAMYLIIDGVIERKNTDETTSMIAQRRRRSCYDYYGEEVLRWAILNYMRSSYYDPLPISSVDVTCKTKVKAFRFTTDDFIKILQYGTHHGEYISEKLKALARIPQKIIRTNSEELEESALTRYNHHQTHEDQLVPRMVAWTCPERGWVKLNCSSIWNPDTKMADMGWVLRDDSGAFIAAGNVAGDEPCMDMFFADALTVNKAIDFCRQTSAFSDSMRKDFYDCQRQVRIYMTTPRKLPLKMVVESDNQFLIDFLIKGPSCLRDYQIVSNLRSIIKDIIGYTLFFEAITFVHCERQYCNAAAHCIAKNAKDDPGCVSDWHSTPPSWLSAALKLDRLLYERLWPEQNDKTEFANEKLEDAHEEEDEEFRRTVNMRKEKKEVLEWMSKNDLPKEMKTQIWNSIIVAEKNIDANVDVDFRFPFLPKNMTRSMKLHLGMIALKKVPMLKNLHEYVLEIICNHLEPMSYNKNTCVVEAGKPLSFMIFVLRGKIKLTAATTSSSMITELCDDKILEDGGFYGEQILSWAAPNNISFSDHPVISTQDVKCETKVEALILKAEDLRSAVSKCGSQWNFSQKLVVGDRDGVSDRGTSASTNNEQTIQLHRGHDMLLEQLVLIRETIFQLRDDMGRIIDDQGQRMDNQGRRLDEMAAFLARLGYTGTSSPPRSSTLKNLC